MGGWRAIVNRQRSLVYALPFAIALIRAAPYERFGGLVLACASGGGGHIIRGGAGVSAPILGGWGGLGGEDG